MSTEQGQNGRIKPRGIGRFHLDLKKDTAIWTDGMFDLLGLPQSDFSGALGSIFELVHPDDRDNLVRVTGLARQGVGDFTRFRIVTRDGAVRQVIGEGDSYRDPDGERRGIIGSVRELIDAESSGAANTEALTAALEALTLAAPLLPLNSEADLAASRAVHLIYRALR